MVTNLLSLSSWALKSSNSCIMWLRTKVMLAVTPWILLTIWWLVENLTIIRLDSMTFQTPPKILQLLCLMNSITNVKVLFPKVTTLLLLNKAKSIHGPWNLQSPNTTSLLLSTTVLSSSLVGIKSLKISLIVTMNTRSISMTARRSNLVCSLLWNNQSLFYLL